MHTNSPEYSIVPSTVDRSCSKVFAITEESIGCFPFKKIYSLDVSLVRRIFNCHFFFGGGGEKFDLLWSLKMNEFDQIKPNDILSSCSEPQMDSIEDKTRCRKSHSTVPFLLKILLLALISFIRWRQLLLLRLVLLLWIQQLLLLLLLWLQLLKLLLTSSHSTAGQADLQTQTGSYKTMM